MPILATVSLNETGHPIQAEIKPVDGVMSEPIAA